ncbi:hypothetical protein SGLAM104S_10255 [Streptomyces glaucescens]
MCPARIARSGQAQVGARHDVVAEAVDGEVRQGAGGLDGVRERLLTAAHRGEVDELRGEPRGVQREIERGIGHAVDPNAAAHRARRPPGSGCRGSSSTLDACQSRPLLPKRHGRLLRCGAAFVVLLAVAGYLAVQYVTGGQAVRAARWSRARVTARRTSSPEQAVNAATITAVGTARGLPERAVTIALATALQESALRNIDHGDRDSLGLFQQRPSQGWGTEKQIMDPIYSAGMFYDHLAEVPGYTQLPPFAVAQRVQRSGFPQAYAKHEPDATLLAAALTGRAGATLTCQGRPDATRVTGPDGVRLALVRDFGRDAIGETGAEVGAEASPRPTVSARRAGGP